jgi:hypothetical protein
MLLSPLILEHEIILKKWGLSSVTNRWGAKVSEIPGDLDPNEFFDILVRVEKEIWATRETVEAQIIPRSILRRNVIVHFSNLSAQAKRIIRANFVLDDELIDMIQKIVPDFPSDFFNT